MDKTELLKWFAETVILLAGACYALIPALNAFEDWRARREYQRRQARIRFDAIVARSANWWK